MQTLAKEKDQSPEVESCLRLKAVPIGELNCKKKNPIVRIRKVSKNNRTSTEKNVPISWPPLVNILFADPRILFGK